MISQRVIQTVNGRQVIGSVAQIDRHHYIPTSKMFEVPSAKRVKRSQLFHSDDEDIVDHDSTGLEKGTKTRDGKNGDEDDVDVLPNYGFEYDFVAPELITSTTISNSKTQQETDVVNSEPEIYSFNLFAPTHAPKQTAATTNTSQSTAPNQDHSTSAQPIKISIRSPSPALEVDPTDPGSITTQRPDSYYFTSALAPSTLQSLKLSYLASAMPHSTLKKFSESPWPGTSVPHRVITLPSHSKQIVIHRPSKNTSSATTTLTTKSIPPHPESTATHTHRRARPSKKRRDLAKLKADRRRILIDETKTKEEHEREKKNKKNRERKLKRRAKERREKEMKGGGSVGGDATVDGSADGSEE